MHHLPETGFLRLPQIIGQEAVTEDQAEENRNRGKGPRRPRPAIPAIVPVKKTAWWQGCRDGRYPKPVKLAGCYCALWRAEHIRALVESAKG